jgi:hypothetical protein
MTRALRLGGIVLIGWGGLLLAFAAVLLGVFDQTVPELALLAGAGGASLLSGVGMALVDLRRGPRETPGLQPGESLRLTELSMATVALCVGVAMIAVGTEVGPWLELIGGGVVVIGLAGLVREALAEAHA